MALSPGDQQAINDLPIRIAEIRAGQDIVRQGDRPSRMCFIIDGFTCSYKMSTDGRRQIVSFHLPGDAPDLQSVHLPSLDISIATITPCRIAFVTHEAIRYLCEKQPKIADAFWRYTLLDAAIYREWIANVAQRSAVSRLAHLLCEMFVRLAVIGDANRDKIPFPITQSELGEATGLSSVHVNRSLQELRKGGYISLTGRTLSILNFHGLTDVGDFNTEYLHLKPIEWV
jgi:CRP-like cAMP-binding protein